MDIGHAQEIETEIATARRAGRIAQADLLAQKYLSSTDGPGVATQDDPSLLPWFRSRYTAAEVAFDGGRLEQVAPLLNELESHLPRVPSRVRRAIYLLAAESLARLGNSADARSRLLHARQCGVPPSADVQLDVQELVTGLVLGDVANLNDELRVCSQRLAQGGDFANLCLLECEQCRAWRMSGSLESADDCLLRAQKVLGRIDDGRIQIEFHIQKGRLAELRGRFQEALDAYRRADNLSAADGPQGQEARLREMLVLVQLGEVHRAGFAFETLMAGSSYDALPAGLRRLARMVGSLLRDDPTAGCGAEPDGYWFAVRGELVAARSAYLQALPDAAGPERRARIFLAIGLTALEAGDYAEASTWLLQCQDVGDAMGLPEVQWRARYGLGRITAEWKGDDATARRLFDEAAEFAEAQAAELHDPLHRAAHRRLRLDATRQLLLAAARRGDVGATFSQQELLRGRLLHEMWHQSAGRDSRAATQTTDELTRLDRRIGAIELVEMGPESRRECVRLKLERDRVRDRLVSQSTPVGGANLPRLVTLTELQQRLPANSTLISASMVGDELVMVAASYSEQAVVSRERNASELHGHINSLRDVVKAQLDRYARGWSIGRPERKEFDNVLDELGRGPLGRLLLRSVGRTRNRVIWIPDGPLHGIPLQAIRLDGRYLIESYELINGFSASLFVHQLAQAKRPWWRRGSAVVVAGAPDGSLPNAAVEGTGVAAGFLRRTVLANSGVAFRNTILRRLSRASVLHIACHAEVSADDPLSSCIVLPSGERWRADEWTVPTVRGLPLVTFSSCRSAEVSALSGHDVFGICCGALCGGVRAVLAGLWSVPDREALDIIWSFYRHRMIHDLGTALALAQREMLKKPDCSPLFWALFALYGDPAALPASRPCVRWWNQWRQRRHARRCRELFPELDVARHP
jgi:tetratricopeptide (TPR) repeat protein